MIATWLLRRAANRYVTHKVQCSACCEEGDSADFYYRAADFTWWCANCWEKIGGEPQ